MKIIIIGFLLFASGVTHAEMVSNDSIGNDPAKEKLCVSRSQHDIKGKAVPFLIDSIYIESARARHPDATFIAIIGISPQLIECFLREGTGRFEPDSMSPEQQFWHLPRPKQFEPGLNTDAGQNMARKACLDSYLAKATRTELDHTAMNFGVSEVRKNGKVYVENKNRTTIAGKKFDDYDIVASGTAFYKSTGPDLDAVHFACLFSPMLEIKAVQTKW